MKILDYLRDEEVEKQSLICMVASKEIAVAKTGNEYAKLELMDSTGKIRGNCFDEKATKLNPGDFVIATVNKGEYQGNPSYSIIQIELADPSLGLSTDDFVYTFVPEVDKLKKILESYYKKLKAPYKGVVDEVFKMVDPDNKFEDWPAAVSMHHDVKHGLIYHTTGILQASDGMMDLAEKHYGLPVNRQLVYAAIILHDFFKLNEYNMSIFGKGEGTKYGILGHIVMVDQFVGYLYYSKKIDEELYLQLSHVLAAHHGKLEYGSPVVPSTVEALIVNKADDLDAKLYMFRNEFEKLEEGEISQAKIFGLDTRVYKPETIK